MYQKFDGADWVACNVEDLNNGDHYRMEIPGGVHESVWYEETLTPIVLTGVSGDIVHNSQFTKVTCNENTDVTITGTLAIPDRAFAVPLRRDDGRLFLFPAQVTNGAFTVVINLPTTGQFTYSDNECNVDLPEKTFTVNTVRIDSLRNTGA